VFTTEQVKKKIEDAVKQVLQLKENKDFSVVLWDEASFQNKPNTTNILVPPNTKATIFSKINNLAGLLGNIQKIQGYVYI
jgi:hypothetical protein